jgi:hypothetical protein
MRDETRKAVVQEAARRYTTGIDSDAFIAIMDAHPRGHRVEVSDRSCVYLFDIELTSTFVARRIHNLVERIQYESLYVQSLIAVYRECFPYTLRWRDDAVVEDAYRRYESFLQMRLADGTIG